MIRKTTLCLIWMAFVACMALAASDVLAQEAAPAVEAVAAAPAAEAAPAPAEFTADTQAKIDNITVAVDTVWTMIAGMLVFFMNLGFALVETGFTRSKNCVNILFKNFVVFAVSALAFFVLGWGLTFGNGNDFFGTEGMLFVSGADNSPAISAYSGAYSAIAWTGVPLWCKFFFQLVFAGTAATIVSGAVAERIKFSSFLAFTLVLVGIIYPIGGHMIWGGGFLAKKGFLDFAGSTVVHSVGGWAALAGVIVLGPRLGKYSSDGKVNAIPGHNMTSAATGVFVLWLGWFGFNPGSTMAAVGYADAIAHVAVTTNSAAIAATLTAMITAWIMFGKPDLGMSLNGCLAGLVAITAPCAFVSVPHSLLIGAIAGILVVFAVIFFDKIKIDDPVGATAVHLANGVFGTLCVGLFGNPAVGPWTQPAMGERSGLFIGGGFSQLGPQLLGIVTVGAMVFALSLVVWLIIKAVMGGIRVSIDEEREGLDLGEHGQHAYPDFTQTSVIS